uniref:Reverse transcriptase domain-containing protein n=1 Tax=Tanacetum cinerariifolium TaxID=118510 RepID=A0A6L2N880_TANCI|nr:reverse transcriptase domain-containing protein [Tanacetum cinerariifolium]
MPLPIIAEKVHKEKAEQDKLKEVKARLNFEGCSGKNSKIQKVSQHSESRAPYVRGDLRRRLRSRRSHSTTRSPEATPSVCSRIRRDISQSPRNGLGDIGRKERGMFKRLRDKGRSVSAHSKSRYQSFCPRRAEPVLEKHYHEGTSSRRTKPFSESEDSGGAHWKSRSKKQKSSIEEDDLSQPWAAAEVAMPTWCHMFNSTLVGSARVWFDDLPSEYMDSYDNLIKTFLANFLEQKKCIKDPVEIHHIKQREGESTEDFVQRFKYESRHVKRAPECMRILGFKHGITNPELIKRLHDNIPKSVDEMMRVSTAFLREEVAASNQA